MGFAGVLCLLAALHAGPGLDVFGWSTGLACGAGVSLLLGRAMETSGVVALGAANRVTLLRAVLVCGVAALIVDRHGAALLVALAATALVLDGVDGRVARRTATVSPLGARFDMEVDAFLILMLSVYVATTAGWWVGLIGAARYVFVLASRALPWLTGTLPPRPWCKVVAVLQGVVLTVAAADLLPIAWSRLALVVALALLAESFGREGRDLWRLRTAGRETPPPRELVDHA